MDDVGGVELRLVCASREYLLRASSEAQKLLWIALVRRWMMMRAGASSGGGGGTRADPASSTTAFHLGCGGGGGGQSSTSGAGPSSDRSAHAVIAASLADAAMSVIAAVLDPVPFIGSIARGLRGVVSVCRAVSAACHDANAVLERVADLARVVGRVPVWSDAAGVARARVEANILALDALARGYLEARGWLQAATAAAFRARRDEALGAFSTSFVSQVYFVFVFVFVF